MYRMPSGSDSSSGYAPQALEALDRVQSIVSGRPGPHQAQRTGSLGCYEECLIQPDQVRVFDDISHF